MAVDGWVSINSIDGNKVPYNEKVYFHQATDTLTNLNAWLPILLADYDAVTQSQIDKVWLHIPVTLPGGLKSAPVAGSNNEIGALEAGKWADMAIWSIERPAELVCRLGFNPLHARVWRGR